jgi:cyclophilin family peptidyl-prolyl cis-trans isomerase
MLAGDDSHNVRYDALVGLRRLRGHSVDAMYIAALGSPDYQLVLAAADALEGSKEAPSAVPALLRAFTRLTTERRETSRDPRMAILRRLQELGTREHAEALQDCLRDFDNAVAAECAATIERWTGTPQIPRPTPIPDEPVIELATNARVTMRSGGVFELRLLTDEAPASASRFARLVQQKYYDGLTFHRVIPNFIIQGGSPGANEYAGDGPFMRDELGLRSHLRGTVGVSTRGRDTGDAQIFINLLDNPRLDHEYTVFAEVTSGIEVVDGILEGDVIDRIELR